MESLSDHSLLQRVIQSCIFFFFSFDQTKLKLDSLHYFVHSLMHLFGLFVLFIGVLVYRSHMHALLIVADVCIFASCLLGH